MRPLLAQLVSHRLSQVGVVLAVASGLVFVGLFVVHLRGPQNPYADIVVFVMLPALFALGLLCMVIGLWRQRTRDRKVGLSETASSKVDLNLPQTRRALFFVAVASLVSLVSLSFASQRAVEFSESQQFCGQACHAVMGPHAEAHQTGLHSQVECVQCHIEPGAQGFIKAKLNGTNQLRLVLTNQYPRPIPSPPQQSIPNVYTSCEQCHWPDRFIGDVIKVVPEYADDEANSETRTTLRLHVGGPVAGTGSGIGIHWHMNRANVVEYVALDEKLEQIPYVRVATLDGKVREYFADGTNPSELVDKPRRRMGCIDCHSRPAHRFGSTPERAVDEAIGAGTISRGVPFIRRAAVRALQKDYPDRDTAIATIDKEIRQDLSGATEIDDAALRRAIRVTQSIYRRNVFPSMKIGWGTYLDHVGHTVSQGCFRCHDESHKTKEGVAIGQDCELCHSIE